ncbi:DUF1471 domain-containing protein [Entomohabitans teleogrylli]|uniref:DUF1471 domain-containing protein n=1 Tax=Entomohabitans teleogrylli TaxID=1384589 RepID=UPI00073D6605|nr:DUF1471 domain-containing protein [Entomohabitans teleogrylli]
MKKFLLAVLTVTSVCASASSFAVQEVEHVDGLHKIGTVSDSSGAVSLSELESHLQAKAQKKGASALRIISVDGNNILSGSADIYR